MNKRAYERIPVDVRVKLAYRDNNYSGEGTITNLSENGVFVEVNELKFPLDSQIVLRTISGKDTIECSAVIKRIIKSDLTSDGLGLEIINIPRNYSEYVKELKSSGNS